jgi:hypothetical protein
MAQIHQIDWSVQPLGEVQDKVLADRLGVSTKLVRSHRVKFGIPRYSGPRKCRISGIDWDAELRLSESDSETAGRLGVSRRSVARARLVRGIPPRFGDGETSERAAVRYAANALKAARRAASEFGQPEPRDLSHARELARQRTAERNHARYSASASASRAIARTARTGTAGTIYFFEFGDWIKIGWTKDGDPSIRFATVQTSNPHKGRILAVIANRSPYQERRIHAAFSKIRCEAGTEFFQRTPELLAFIAGHAEIYECRSANQAVREPQRPRMPSRPSAEALGMTPDLWRRLTPASARETPALMY